MFFFPFDADGQLSLVICLEHTYDIAFITVTRPCVNTRTRRSVLPASCEVLTGDQTLTFISSGGPEDEEPLRKK
jgi:hypothetical protein